MTEIFNLADILSLGGSVTVTGLFLLFLRVMVKDNRKEREASEKRYAGLLEDNTEARKRDHDARNEQTKTLLLVHASLQTSNQINGANQKKCAAIQGKLDKAADIITTCPMIEDLTARRYKREEDV